jgi:recombination protein RecA
MSSAVVSTSAAHGRPFLFDAGSHITHVGTAAIGCPVERSSAELESTIKNQPSKILPSGIVPASRLEVRPAPEMASSGIPEIDALTGGLPRGCLTEICGPASSGRTTVLLAALSAATVRGEYCALIDASDALDPQSLDAARVDLDRLLWVRCVEDSPRRHGDMEKKKSQKGGCPILAGHFAARVGISSETQLDFVGNKSRPSEHRLEQVLRVTDLLLESGGFGLIILDLADVAPQSARRIPLTTWFRFRRAVEHKPTILLSIEQQPIAGSCSSLLLQLAAAKRRQRKKTCVNDSASIAPTHAHLLSGLEITAELIRSRLDRKPSQSITLDTKTAWAG